MDKLTGLDYFSRPFIELQSHPDFSYAAYQNVDKISKMRTTELEVLNLFPTNETGVTNG